jgi:ssDNA-binding Zn-finger/Zn-ribbon topoisomerase 1
MSKISFDSLLGDSELDMTCPNCNAKVNFKLSDVGKSVKCPSCKNTIKINKSSNYGKATKDVDNALKDFEKALKNFGK